MNRKCMMINMCLAALAFVMCSASYVEEETGRPRMVSVGQEFDLSYSEEVFLKDENLKVEFSVVNANSLCPKGVECAWEGKFVITVKVNGKNAELSIGEKAAPSQTVGDYEITLVDLLAPELTSDTSTQLSDYKVALKVERV